MITRDEIDKSELARGLAVLSQQSLDVQIFSGVYGCVSDVPDVPSVKLTSPAQLSNCVELTSPQDDLFVGVIDNAGKVTQWEKLIMEDGSVRLCQKWSTEAGRLIVIVGEQAVCVSRSAFVGAEPPTV